MQKTKKGLSSRQRKQQQSSKKGFTLIELLAVIVILGILMLVAIPAVSRTIENARRDTFMNTAKAYINSIKNAVAADEISCPSGSSISSVAAGDYYYSFSSADTTGTDLMEQGGKSAWGKDDVTGIIKITKSIDGVRTTYSYSIQMIDGHSRGIDTMTEEKGLSRNVVKTKSAAAISVPTDATVCAIDIN